MKKVLITGANSYIGCHVENWLKSGDGRISKASDGGGSE